MERVEYGRGGGFGAALEADSVAESHGADCRQWRGGQGSYFGQPYRPIITDFNAIYQPSLSKKVGLDLFGGIGVQSTRFYGYQPTYSCYALGACFSSNHNFLVDAGAGVRYYVWGPVFVRPELHYYHIVNNTNDFSNNDGFA